MEVEGKKVKANKWEIGDGCERFREFIPRKILRTGFEGDLSRKAPIQRVSIIGVSFLDASVSSLRSSTW